MFLIIQQIIFKNLPFCKDVLGHAYVQVGDMDKAIDEYEEVLDYFPNVINYASAALYRIGQCHWKNGDIKKAMKAWAEMANDKDYSRHPLAAQ